MIPNPGWALVLDASVGIRIVRREPGWNEAFQILSDQRAQDRQILVPDFFWLELINVLVRKYRFLPAAVLEALAVLDAAGIETVELDRPMLLSVLDAVARHGLTAYDATYLALAESTDADLLTADARLAAAAGDRARLVGGEEIRETRPAYPQPSWADWPGAAAYLQELRKRVLSGT